jgi:hypothetical protein
MPWISDGYSMQEDFQSIRSALLVREVRQVLRGDRHALGGGNRAAARANPSRHRWRKPVSGTTCGNRFNVGPVQTSFVRSWWLLSAMRHLVWPNNRLNSMVD